MQESSSVSGAYLVQTNPELAALHLDFIIPRQKELEPDKHFFSAMAFTDSSCRRGGISPIALAQLIERFPESSLLLFSSFIKQWLKNENDDDSGASLTVIKAIQTVMDQTFGSAKNEFRRLIVYLGIPWHICCSLLSRRGIEFDEGTLSLAAARLLCDISLGPRELKLILGKERIIRGII